MTECGSDTSFQMVKGVQLEIQTINDIEITVERKTKVTGRNQTFHYLNLFVKNQQSLSPGATGLIGQYTLSLRLSSLFLDIYITILYIIIGNSLQCS